MILQKIDKISIILSVFLLNIKLLTKNIGDKITDIGVDKPAINSKEILVFIHVSLSLQRVIIITSRPDHHKVYKDVPKTSGSDGIIKHPIAHKNLPLKINGA
jgi:hypothetical protein